MFKTVFGLFVGVHDGVQIVLKQSMLRVPRLPTSRATALRPVFKKCSDSIKTVYVEGVAHASIAGHGYQPVREKVFKQY